MNAKLVGKRIRNARKACGFSQEQLAERIDVSTRYISDIERGKSSSSFTNFVALANALETTADCLLMDVLDFGYSVRVSKIMDYVEVIPQDERNRVMDIIENFLIAYLE